MLADALANTDEYPDHLSLIRLWSAPAIHPLKYHPAIKVKINHNIWRLGIEEIFEVIGALIFCCRETFKHMLGKCAAIFLKHCMKLSNNSV